MSCPKIKFQKNERKDWETLMTFTKEAQFDNGRNLNWAIFNTFPQLKKYFDKDKHYQIKDKEALRNFVSKTYHNKKISMDRSLAQRKKRWQKIAPNFDLLIAALFGNLKWPRGKYIAFGTILGMYPRFLEDKTFQIPFWHRTPKYTTVIIAHELLHFIFYSYFYARYPKYRNPKYNFLVWQISEIFNTIIQNSPEWVACFKLKSMGYPEHKKISTRISRIFYRNKLNIDKLTDEIIREVKKSL